MIMKNGTGKNNEMGYNSINTWAMRKVKTLIYTRKETSNRPGSGSFRTKV